MSPTSPVPFICATTLATGEASLIPPIDDPRTPSSSPPTALAEVDEAEDVTEADAGQPELPSTPMATTSSSITDTSASLHRSLLDTDRNAPPDCPAHPLFEIIQLGVDRYASFSFSSRVHSSC